MPDCAQRSCPYRSAFDLHVSHLLLAGALSKLPPTKSFASALPWCYMYTPNMAKSSPHFFRQTLEKLAEEPPTTKTALLRSLLPQIQLALRSGKTLKQVWQRLAQDGLDISCETFCRLIRRARANPHASAAPSGKSVDAPPASIQATEGNDAYDPLANLKRLEANRPGFHWRATKTPR